MRHKKLSALLVSCTMVAACGNGGGLQKDSKVNPKIQADKDAYTLDIEVAENDLKLPAFNYLVHSPSAKVKSKEMVGGSHISYSGTLSEPAKDLVRDIWTNLVKKGFLGYDPTQLSKNNIPFSSGSFVVVPYWPGIKEGYTNNFHTHLIQKLNGMEESFIRSFDYTGYVDTLFGMQFKGKYLLPVYRADKKYPKTTDVSFVLATSFREGTDGSKILSHGYPLMNPSDIVVTKEQRAEWDQVFIDAIKKHPVLANNLDETFFTPSDSADILGETGALTSTSMRHQVAGGSIHAPQLLSQDVKINTPVHVKMAGNPLEENSLSVTSVFWKTNNTLFGLAGVSLNHGRKHTQLDINLTSTMIMGQGFFEFQGGPISTTSYKTNERQWSGYRQAYVLGYDFTNGLTPFAQVVVRSLETNSRLQETQTSAYFGINSDKEVSNHLLTNKLSATVKVGEKFDTLSDDSKKTQNRTLDYGVNMEHTFGAESINLSLAISIGSQQTNNLKLSVTFEQ